VAWQWSHASIPRRSSITSTGAIELRLRTGYWVLVVSSSHLLTQHQLPAASCRLPAFTALLSLLRTPLFLCCFIIYDDYTSCIPSAETSTPFLDDLLIRLVHYIDYRWKVLRLASFTKFISPLEPCSSPQTNVRATKTSFGLCSLLCSLRISTVFRPAKQSAGALCVPSFVQVTALGTRLHQLHLPTIPSILASGLDFHSPCKKVIAILCCNIHKAPMHNHLTASLYPHQWR
jgi:hypothetical protein